jgi:hypothetical protein
MIYIDAASINLLYLFNDRCILYRDFCLVAMQWSFARILLEAPSYGRPNLIVILYLTNFLISEFYNATSYLIYLTTIFNLIQQICENLESVTQVASVTSYISNLIIKITTSQLLERVRVESGTLSCIKLTHKKIHLISSKIVPSLILFSY